MRPRKRVVGWILIVAMTSSAMTSSSNHSSVAVLSKRQNANKTQDHWWGCGVSHSAHAAPLREAVAQQAATHMSFNTGGASPKCTLPDQLRLHRQHVHLFAGRHYIDYVQRLSKHFVRVHDEAVHVLFVGVAGAERAMVDDFLKCRDIHVHTLSSESKTSASVAALTGVYGTCPNVHVRDAKALLPADVPPAPAPAPVPSLAAWADRQRLKRFDLVSVNLRPSETLTLLQGMAMSNDTNLDRFGNILFRLDSKNTLLAGQQHDPVSGAPGTGTGTGTGAGNATAAEDARLFDTAKLLVAHGYELYLLKCQFGGGSLQIDAEFFGEKSPTTGGAATWRGAAGDPSATSVLAVHMMYVDPPCERFTFAP
jgi:hypothetical protein